MHPPSLPIVPNGFRRAEGTGFLSEGDLGRIGGLAPDEAHPGDLVTAEEIRGSDSAEVAVDAGVIHVVGPGGVASAVSPGVGGGDAAEARDAGPCGGICEKHPVLSGVPLSLEGS
jgi:hypothetical protein